MAEAQSLLTVEQTAQRMKAGRTTVYGLVRTGELDSVKVGRLRRIPVDAIDRYIARQLAEIHGSAVA